MDHDPLVITRSKAPSVVLLSTEDFQSLEETAYLLPSPANARRLFAAVEQLDNGQGTVRDLPE